MLSGCTATSGGGAPGGVSGQSVLVSRVVDGDTVHVTPVDGSGPAVKVRLLGIDAPELHDRNGHLECWADRATDFARDTLLGRTVHLVGDPTQDARDRYDRVLGYLILADGSSFSVLAAGAGAARSYVYDRPAQEHSAILWAEAQAHAARRGLWGACAG